MFNSYGQSTDLDSPGYPWPLYRIKDGLRRLIQANDHNSLPLASQSDPKNSTWSAERFGPCRLIAHNTTSSRSYVATKIERPVVAWWIHQVIRDKNDFWTTVKKATMSFYGANCSLTFHCSLTKLPAKIVSHGSGTKSSFFSFRMLSFY